MQDEKLAATAFRDLPKGIAFKWLRIRLAWTMARMIDAQTRDVLENGEF
jgi:hypothetical protein